ncbi:MAG TPA: preprotein translocase subunit SecG [Burkholderiaceae bacterium]|nr:preprotein translocase subunit SecG [Burkholderiaceae bacterium]
MGWILTLLIVVQVLCAAAIIILVLLQHGKGADMGAAFGSGASGSLFGASGSANFLSRSTAVIAAIFFCVTIGLAYSATNLRTPRGGLMSTTAPSAPSANPSTPVAPPASEQVPSDANPAGAAPASKGSAAQGSDKSAEIPK